MKYNRKEIFILDWIKDLFLRDYHFLILLPVLQTCVLLRLRQIIGVITGIWEAKEQNVDQGKNIHWEIEFVWKTLSSSATANTWPDWMLFCHVTWLHNFCHEFEHLQPDGTCLFCNTLCQYDDLCKDIEDLENSFRWIYNYYSPDLPFHFQ